jgi:iron complex outermembrane recepter protein
MKAPRQPRATVGVLCAAAASVAVAQSPQQPPAAVLDPLVVTATRSAERALDIPAAIDVVDAQQIQHGQLQINLSESLARVPGMFIQNRWNYAQDLMLSIRGFGARANFGVRGVRLYQDYIPVTMPDGQGQTSSFSLVSARRIEVLRGPFSTLYGNASGGVISVFTEDGPAPPQVSLQAIGGSFGTSNLVAKIGGQTDLLNFEIAGNRFETDGYRDHSEARRELLNAKLSFEAGPDTQVTLIGNIFNQPFAQDPLGLTRAQWEANPRQADPVATLFDTRKTVSQTQGGVTVAQKLPYDSVFRATAYGGTRTVQQFLSFPGTAITSSGGVTDLDRTFGGIDARVTTPFAIGGGRLQITLGADYESEREARKGFVNNNGILGDLRRDEDNTVTNSDLYAQLEWWPMPSVSVLAGVRYSDVRFTSDDHFIVVGNPDDSGSVSYTHTSPVGGAVWHLTEAVNVYASYGQGFETPTFTELAYRPVGSGLNLGLEPSVSTSAEVGLKAISGSQRVNVAAFWTDTKNELVINAATGGRTTYKNAAKTKRRGVEAAWEGDLGAGFAGYAAYTYLDATYASSLTTGAPPVTVPAGNRLPGVPQSSAYAELSWSRPAWYGFNAALELAAASKVYVNDANSDAAPGYLIGNLRAGFAQQSGRWQFREFVRLNNIGNVNYVGSVIVGDTNGRYFEPAATRNFIIGISVNASL